MVPPKTSTASQPAQEAQKGGAVKGAARGTLVGVTVGAITNNSKGRSAAAGAAAGGLIGGMRRQEQGRQQNQVAHKGNSRKRLNMPSREPAIIVHIQPVLKVKDTL